MIAVTAAFVTAGQFAAHSVDSLAAADFPGDRIIDHVLTPSPLNPFCWDVLLLATRGDRYAVRHGVLSNAPALIRADRCPTLTGNRPTTAPMTRVSAADSAAMHWFGAFEMSKTRLAELVAGHCDAAALMLFARAPFATQFEGQAVLGDLRFDRERGLGMAEIAVGPPSATACRPPAPWTAPRADLLH
jgi:inner membrane protein